MRGHAVIILGALLASTVPVHAQLASGMVEDLKGAPQAGVDLMDWIYPGQRIVLGSGGELSLSYLSSCRVETIKGGTVTVGQSESRVEGGTLRAQNRPCDPKKFAATTQTAEAGAAVKRVTPFDTRGGDETALSSLRPVFRWQEGGGTVRLFAVDKPKPELVWSGAAQKSYIEYPTAAPKLLPSVPYTVEVVSASGKKSRADFIINPDLKLADTLMNRTVLVKN